MSPTRSASERRSAEQSAARAGRQRFGAFQVVPVDRRHASSLNRQTLAAALMVEVDPGGDQDDQDGSDEPVDDQAERRPPASIGHIVAALLPKVLEPMTGEADHQQPRRSGDGDAASTTKTSATPLSTARTIGR